MHRIAFYGKGGIGKSTIATSASLTLARRGMRVLHVGCDPKHDSSLVLVKNTDQFKTVIDQIFDGAEDLEPEDLIMEGIQGIACVESGGPQAGRGCGGRAVSRSFELFEEIDLVNADEYDATIYDVLGDVVCGGFAAPMRKSAGTKVVVVLSEELMAAYAANRTAAAVGQLEKNGIVLAGLVTNLKKGRNLRTLHRRLRARVAVVGREGVVTDLDRRHGGGYSATVPFESVGLHNVKRAVPLGWSVEHRRRPRPRPRAHRPAETAYRQQSRDSQPKRIHAQLVGWLKPCP